MVPYEISRGPNTGDLIVSQAVRSVFAERKRPVRAQFSQIKRAHPVSRGVWVLCLRGSDPAQPRQYALYFTGQIFVHSQLAAQVDGCGDDMYQPFTGDLTARR